MVHALPRVSFKIRKTHKRNMAFMHHEPFKSIFLLQKNFIIMILIYNADQIPKMTH